MNVNKCTFICIVIAASARIEALLALPADGCFLVLVSGGGGGQEHCLCSHMYRLDSRRPTPTQLLFLTSVHLHYHSTSASSPSSSSSTLSPQASASEGGGTNVEGTCALTCRTALLPIGDDGDRPPKAIALLSVFGYEQHRPAELRVLDLRTLESGSAESSQQEAELAVRARLPLALIDEHQEPCVQVCSSTMLFFQFCFLFSIYCTRIRVCSKFVALSDF